MTWKVQVLVAQLCPTLCDPMGYSSPGSSVHEILQARILEWVVISSSRGTTRPRDWTQVSCITGRFFTIWATRGRPSWAQKLLEFLKIVCNLMIKKKGVRSLKPPVWEIRRKKKSHHFLLLHQHRLLIPSMALTTRTVLRFCFSQTSIALRVSKLLMLTPITDSWQFQIISLHSKRGGSVKRVHICTPTLPQRMPYISM